MRLLRALQFNKDFVPQGIAVKASKPEFKTQFDLLEELNLIEDKIQLLI